MINTTKSYILNLTIMENIENKNKDNSRFSNKGGRPVVSKGLARTKTMSTRMTVAEKMKTKVSI